MSKNKVNRLAQTCVIAGAIMLTLIPCSAQSGGPFTVRQSVVSDGGQTKATAGQFVLGGTVGQSAAGDITGGSTTHVNAGFWSPAFVPVVVQFSLSGKILTAGGAGLKNATVSLTDPQGVVQRVTSSTFGFYLFDNLSPGKAYYLTVQSKRFRFSPQTLVLANSISNYDLVGVE